MSAVIDTPAGNYGETQLNGSRILRDETGITVTDETAGPRIPKSGEFDENLAELMDESERRSLATRLVEYLEVDKESRKDWYERGERGLALMGVTDIPDDDENSARVNAPGDAQVRMPMLAEGVTRFQARAKAELFPPTGPVKAKPFAKNATPEQYQQAQRIEQHGNYYLTVLDTGYYPDSDEMLMALPIYGSVFRKCAQNWVTGMPELRWVKSENFIAPYSAKSLKEANRYAHEYTMTGQDIRRAMESGMFARVELRRPLQQNMSAKTADKSDNRVYMTHDDDAIYNMAEYHIDCELPVDSMGYRRGQGIGEEYQDLLSYIVVVDTDNLEVLLCRRNWKQVDPTRQKRVWFAHHKFFPGLGFYGWGYPHLIGTLQKASGDGVNALLDNAFLNNNSGGFTTKEAKAVGIVGPFEMEPGVFKQLDGTYEELSKAIWTPDFKPPSPALAQLVEQLIGAGQRFMSTTEAAVGDGDNRGPVGTTLAMIEQSNIVPTGIHSRLHFSLCQELNMWADAVFEYMPNRYDYEAEGEQRYLLKSDFDGRIDIGLVSDPNIWSNQQRLTLNQGVLELQAQAPDLYSRAKRIAAHRRMLDSMRVPNPEEVAPDDEKKPLYADPVAENGMLMVGEPVRAFEQQDHNAHMVVHEHGKQMMIASQAFVSMLPEKQQQVMAAFDAHQMEHMALGYRRMVMQSAGIPLPPLDESGMQPELPPEIEAQITAAVVQRLPPPTPPQAAVDEGAEQAAIIKAKAQADIEAKAMQSQAQVARETEAFVKEEARKQEAFKAEQARLAEAHAAEQARVDTEAATQIMRDNAKAKVDRENSRRAAEIKIEQAEVAGDVKLAQTQAQGEQKLEHGEKTTEQKLAHADAATKQKLESADKQVGQKLEHTDKAHEQSMSIAEKDAQQARRHKAGEHSQETKHANEDHEISQEHAQEDHERLIERGDKEHKQSMKQAGESGKLKVQQAKDAARAKKANKSGAKK